MFCKKEWKKEKAVSLLSVRVWESSKCCMFVDYVSIDSDGLQRDINI